MAGAPATTPKRSSSYCPPDERSVSAAAVEDGKGATKTLGRIAAETLQLPLEWVRYGAINTDHTPLDNGTHASCGTAVTGIAVMRAAADARGQVLEFAAERLGCTADELALDNWTVARQFRSAARADDHGALWRRRVRIHWSRHGQGPQ